MTTCTDQDVIYLVRNDNGPQIKATLTREDTGLAVDLTNATPRLRIRKKRTTETLLTITGVDDDEVDKVNGEMIFVFTAENLSIPAGEYDGEIEVSFENLNVETVYETINIVLRGDFGEPS